MHLKKSQKQKIPARPSINIVIMEFIFLLFNYGAV